MTDFLIVLATAAKAALCASSELADIVGDRIYDHIPPNTVYPYIADVDHEAEPDDTDVSEDNIIDWTLHVYSQYDGTKECYEIIGLIDDILRNPDFECEGLTNIDRSFRAVVPDGDGKTRHGIVRYRVRMEKEV